MYLVLLKVHQWGGEIPMGNSGTAEETGAAKEGRRLSSKN